MTQRTRDPFSLLFITDDAQLQKRIISNVLQHDPARRSSTKKSKNNLLNARSKRKGKRYHFSLPNLCRFTCLIFLGNARVCFYNTQPPILGEVSRCQRLRSWFGANFSTKIRGFRFHGSQRNYSRESCHLAQSYLDNSFYMNPYPECFGHFG